MEHANDNTDLDTRALQAHTQAEFYLAAMFGKQITFPGSITLKRGLRLKKSILKRWVG